MSTTQAQRGRARHLASAEGQSTFSTSGIRVRCQRCGKGITGSLAKGRYAYYNCWT